MDCCDTTHINEKDIMSAPYGNCNAAKNKARCRSKKSVSIGAKNFLKDTKLRKITLSYRLRKIDDKLYLKYKKPKHILYRDY